MLMCFDAQSFSLKRGDRLPHLRARLLDAADAPIALSGLTVTFAMARADTGALVFENPVVVEEAADGRVRYEWQGSDTATAGFYRAEWRLTDAQGRRQSVPSDHYLRVNIYEDLP